MNTAPAKLLRPGAVAEVSAMLLHGTALAGGTDLLVQRRAGLAADCLVDLTGLTDAPVAVRDVGTADEPTALTLSAVHPLALIVEELAGRFGALAAVAGVFASQQIRNRATLGGNLATGSPAADTVPALLVAETTICIRGVDGRREVPLGAFLLGPRRVDLAPGEWIETVTVHNPTAAGGFRKVGGRRALAISFLNLAWQWRSEADGTLRDVRLAMGAVAPTVVRLHSAEAVLEGQRYTPGLLTRAAEALQHDISPIDDLRASERYRRKAADGLLREAVLDHEHATGNGPAQDDQGDTHS